MVASVGSGTEIVVSAGGSMEPGLTLVAAAFQAATGHRVKITYRHDIDDPDVLVMPKDAVDRKSGFAGNVEAGAIRVARSSTGLGVAVRLGAPLPNVANVDEFKKSLLDTD